MWRQLLHRDRPVTVCERWRESFAAFLADMGPRPSPKHSVNRINTSGIFEPSNCQWTNKRTRDRRPALTRMEYLGVAALDAAARAWVL